MSKDLDAHAWLKYAEEDLDVAELLLKSGFHRHALFWVEQASEKTLKVYLIAYYVKELDNILNRCKDLGISDEDIKTLEELRNKVNEFRNPKTFRHICEGKGIKKVNELFYTYLKAISHPLIRRVLIVSSDIRRKMSVNNRYEKVFREVEKQIGEAIKSIQISSVLRCEEHNAFYIVQKFQGIEGRAGSVRGAILNIVQEEQRKYKGDKIAEQAVLDCRHAYLAFLDSITAMLYLELHAYLCQCFEITRYPGGREIPKDVIKNLPQIIVLLRKNLERVKRLVEQYRQEVSETLKIS